jgi:hypothetical protein
MQNSKTNGDGEADNARYYRNILHHQVAGKELFNKEKTRAR